MALSGNALSEIGDSIIFQMQVPITGLSSITGYTENVGGTTATRFFDREFRYSLDGGLNWTNYQGMSAATLAAVPVMPNYDVMFEYKYTRAGTDPSGVLVFNDVTIQGVYQNSPCADIFQNSIFAYFNLSCNSDEVKLWCVNVLNKLYKPGIVSKSLIREVNQNQNEEDRDYIDFWRAITCYFALIVVYARQFEKFQTNQSLLLKYLRSRDLYACEQQSLADLNYLMRNYYDEMRQRGTFQIATKKGTILHGTTTKPVDGELLRLICYNSLCDEFLFAVQEFDSAGWVVNRWSPLWQGVTHQAQLTKLYETSADFVDLTKYPLINAANCSIVTDGTKSVLSINGVANGAKAGIGFTTPDFTKATNVSPEIPYEISFYIKQVNANTPFSVRLYGYDSSNNPQSIREVKSSALMPVTNDAIVQATMTDSTQYQHVRVVVYPRTHAYNPADDIDTPTIGVGQNLMLTDNVCKIIPEIVLDNNTGAVSGEIRIWDMKFAPLSTPYSTGFVGVSKLIQTWMKNNNGSINSDQLLEIMKYKLLPMGSAIKNNAL